jgi:hypothetical protein
MKPALILAQVLSTISICWAQQPKPEARLEAEYYVAAYAQHYRVPVGAGTRHCRARVALATVRGLSQSRCRTNAVNAPNRSATRSKGPVQCRSKRFRGRAIPRMANATIS